MLARELTGEGADASDPPSTLTSQDSPTAREVLESLAIVHPHSERLADDLELVRALEAGRVQVDSPVGVLSPQRWERYLRSIAQFPAQATGARRSGAPDWND